MNNRTKQAFTRGMAASIGRYACLEYCNKPLTHSFIIKQRVIYQRVIYQRELNQRVIHQRLIQPMDIG